MTLMIDHEMEAVARQLWPSPQRLQLATGGLFNRVVQVQSPVGTTYLKRFTDAASSGDFPPLPTPASHPRPLPPNSPNPAPPPPLPPPAPPAGPPPGPRPAPPRRPWPPPPGPTPPGPRARASRAQRFRPWL